MSYKKLLTVILVIIGGMFALMLTTSYAWYSYEEASTTFDVGTNSDDITVTFSKGAAINTTTAVPIEEEDVERHAEKNNFKIKVKNNVEDTELVVGISLVDIEIDPDLMDPNFKIDLYHQGTFISSVTGEEIGDIEENNKEIGTVTLDNNIDNDFELRIYILDNGQEQNILMKKNFRAKIKIEVVSRLNNTVSSFSNPDIYITSIMIDGVESSYLPTRGYYEMSATCSKGSKLSWEPLSKTITYEKGSHVNDTCNLEFIKSTKYPLLNTVESGSYVAYTGTNGCDGKHCEGDNANYVDSKNMGYCSSSDFKFVRNGWRVAYTKDDTVYLISAGSPECVSTYMDSKMDSIVDLEFGTNKYYYGKGYTFDKVDGTFTLTGVTTDTLSWKDSYEEIIKTTPYTCKGSTAKETCTELVEVVEYSNETVGKIKMHYNYDIQEDVSTHIDNLNKVASTYCNKKYAYGSTCDSSSVWNMNEMDFQNILGKTTSIATCFGNASNKNCGYANDLIDIGGEYWFANANVYGDFSHNMYSWSYRRNISSVISSNHLGIRPIIRLNKDVYITGGSGSYDDPYTIGIKK